MEAVIFKQTGPAESVLSTGELQTPFPSSDQVLIKTIASPIQPADFLFIEGRYRITPAFPQAAGLEGVGIVSSVGDGVQAHAIGDLVAFRAPGAWGEYVCAPVNRTYRVPDGIPTSTASQFALNPLTAWALLDAAHVKEAGKVLLTAGKSVVAGLCAELARRKGLDPYFLVRENGSYCLTNSSRSEQVERTTVAETLGAISDLRFDAIIDAVGGKEVPTLIDVCRPGATLVSYGVLDQTVFSMPVSKIIYKNLTWHGFGIDSWLNNASPEVLDTAQSELWALLIERPDLLAVRATFNRTQILDAIESAKNGKFPGKVLIAG